MRKLAKLPIPTVLRDSASTWLAEYVADSDSEARRTRYRHPEIKETIRRETGWKCVYCESKLGHNTPGDIEHKIPTSKNEALRFEWANLTSACTECNRRKGAYYEIGAEFLDPYLDDVEGCLVHLGPLVYWMPGEPRAEVTVRTLELDSGKRVQLFERKRDTLEKVRALQEVTSAPASDILRALRQDELAKMCEPTSEYSAMVCAYLAAVASREGPLIA